jgi:hypothetical protein
MNQMTCLTFVVAMAAITALLFGSVLTVTQPTRIQAQDTWELTLTTHDVPKQYTKVSFEVWKGSTDSGVKLASGLAMTNKGFASEAFNIDWNSVGDGDYYTVCYQGRTNGPAMDYSASKCSLTVHHANQHIELSTNWGKHL